MATLTHRLKPAGLRLVVSYHAKDLEDKTDRYIEVYREKEMAAIFVSESNFEKMSGQDITVAPGGTVESDVLAPFSEPFAYVVCDEEYAMYKAEKIVM